MHKKLVLTIMILLSAVGCQRRRDLRLQDYETLANDPRRNTQAAREHNARAVEFLKDNQLEQADKELKAAMAMDLFFGPAHNNLGTVYYRQKKFYLAAWEFQYAAKLMPNRAGPRNNLGLVFEEVGKLDEATKWYEEALEIDPDAIEIVGNLARVYVRKNRKDEKTRQLLSEIVIKDQRPDWIAWAKERLALMSQPASTTTQPAEK